jgi:hypothetical protein
LRAVGTRPANAVTAPSLASASILSLPTDLSRAEGRRRVIRTPCSLVGWGVAGRERLFRRLVDRFLFGFSDFLFGSKPVVEIRAGLIASPEVEFVSSSPDSFFE